MNQRRSIAGVGYGLLAILFALGFIIGPIYLDSNGHPLPTSSTIILLVFGVLLLIVGGAVTTITRLYHKTSAYEAFVRTGMGGPKVVVDGGSIVIPVVHNVTFVTLATQTIKVERSGQDALRTKDFFRANVIAEFFIHIPKELKYVQAAATSLGSHATDSNAIQQMLNKKLESALRQVAGLMDFQELFSDRDKLMASVKNHILADIEPNGFTLEAFVISTLEQAPPDKMHADDNIFDAQGNRNIVEVTTAQAVESNRLKQEADVKIAQRQFETDQVQYGIAVQRSQAEAERDQRIAILQANSLQESALARARTKQATELANVDTDQALQLAGIQRDQEIAVAQQRKAGAEEAAEIENNQTVELAKRNRSIALSKKEQEQAIAEAERLAATAREAQAEQDVQTVNATAEAKRQADTQTINARAASEQAAIKSKQLADQTAYSTTSAAEAEAKGIITRAEAAFKAAENSANAKLVAAEADKKAKELQAAADEALALVPVNIEREQVAVDADRVAVERQRLEQQEKYAQVSVQKELALAQISANKEVDIARANALGEALRNANIQLFGDQNSLARFSEAFNSGHQASMFLSGLESTLPENIKEHLSDLVEAATSFLREQAGVEITPDQKMALTDRIRAAAQTKPVNATSI